MKANIKHVTKIKTMTVYISREFPGVMSPYPTDTYFIFILIVFKKIIFKNMNIFKFKKKKKLYHSDSAKIIGV